MKHWNALPDLTPENHERHLLHADERIWVEKNCYIDIWIEVLHALKLEPRAVLPMVFGIDFEGDQWTFFKPPHEDIQALYGVDVQELNVWRTLIEHAAEYLSAGKLISTEADAFWLPDTAGTDYRRQHQKTTIVLADLDLEGGSAGYFHNAGYYRLDGEDFRRTFRLDAPADEVYLPLFAEVVRFDRIVHRPTKELAAMSLELLRRHAARRPATNPIRRFAQRFTDDVPLLQEKGLAYYHAWAFGTIRQLGAAFELATLNLRWLVEQGYEGLETSIDAFDQIAIGNKTLILKAARAATSRKPFEPEVMLTPMIEAWDRGMTALDQALARA